MPHTTPLLALALSTLIAATAAHSPEDAALASVVASRLHGDRSGACLAVAVVDRQVARAFVCADPDASPRIGPESAFEIGSVAKTMTGLLLADLIVRGEASLDEPLADLLPPQAKVPRHPDGEILLHHLASHSSGLARLPPGFQARNPADPYADLDAGAVLEALAASRPAHAPGQRFDYSNFAPMLLSLGLATRTGMDYETLLHRRLFQPLGMAGAHVERRPQGVVAAQGHLPNGQPTAAWQVPGNLAGLGGVRATLDDMVRYAQAQLGRGPEALDEAIVLSQQPLPDAPRPMALFWLRLPLHQREVLTHEGATGGYSSYMSVDRTRGRAVVVLSDTVLTDLGGLAEIGHHLLDPGLPLGGPRRPATADAALLDGLVGRYLIGETLHVRLKRHGDSLSIQADGQPAFTLGYDSRGDFYPLLFPARLSPRAGSEHWTFDWHQGGAVESARRLDEIAPPGLELAAYVGVYRLTPQFAIRFFVVDGRLHAQATGQSALALDYAGVDRFVMATVGAEMQFERDASGQIKAMTLHQGGAVQRGVRE